MRVLVVQALKAAVASLVFALYAAAGRHLPRFVSRDPIPRLRPKTHVGSRSCQLLLTGETERARFRNSTSVLTLFALVRANSNACTRHDILLGFRAAVLAWFGAAAA